jgi:hypothetical protein
VGAGAARELWWLWENGDDDVEGTATLLWSNMDD